MGNNKKELDDFTLVENVRSKGCSDSILELIERHKPLCIKVFKRYSRPLVDKNYYHVNFEEDIPIIFLTAISSFNVEKKCKFNTWLGNHVRYFCLNTLNAKKLSEITLDQHPILEKLAELDDNQEFIDFALNLLGRLKDKRIKKIFELRYLPGPPETNWQEVASKVNISIPTAIKLHDYGIDLLRSKMKSKNVCDKI